MDNADTMSTITDTTIDTAATFTDGVDGAADSMDNMVDLNPASEVEISSPYEVTDNSSLFSEPQSEAGIDTIIGSIDAEVEILETELEELSVADSEDMILGNSDMLIEDSVMEEDANGDINATDIENEDQSGVEAEIQDEMLEDDPIIEVVRQEIKTQIENLNRGQSEGLGSEDAYLLRLLLLKMLQEEEEKKEDWFSIIGKVFKWISREIFDYDLDKNESQQKKEAKPDSRLKTSSIESIREYVEARKRMLTSPQLEMQTT